MKRWMVSVASCLVLVAGCGDTKQNPTPDGKVQPDGGRSDGKIDGKTDGKTDGPIKVPDGAPKPDSKPQADLPPPQPSILQAVLNTMTMPKSSTDFGYDFDGKGKKNQLGAIIAVTSSLGLQGFDFQTNINNTLAAGSFILLLDVQAKSITSDPAMVMQGFHGQDNATPPDPSKIFSGSANLKVTPGSPLNHILPGKIAASVMTVGPGNMLFPIFGSTVQVQDVHLSSTLSSTPLAAMTAGVINAVIPWTEVDTKILPVMATNLNTTYNATTTAASVKALLKSLFDTDGNGTITAAELRGNLLLKVVLAPDVDTDKDGTPDALSYGVGFTAVGCTITK